MTNPTPDREGKEPRNAEPRSTERALPDAPVERADSAPAEDETSFGSEADVDAALDMTFPASDPPAWMGGGGKE
jgi:hypothetical protein